jgi:hypothetical protein
MITSSRYILGFLLLLGLTQGCSPRLRGRPTAKPELPRSSVLSYAPSSDGKSIAAHYHIADKSDQPRSELWLHTSVDGADSSKPRRIPGDPSAERTVHSPPVVWDPSGTAFIYHTISKAGRNDTIKLSEYQLATRKSQPLFILDDKQINKSGIPLSWFWIASRRMLFIQMRDNLYAVKDRKILWARQLPRNEKGERFAPAQKLDDNRLIGTFSTAEGEVAPKKQLLYSYDLTTHSLHGLTSVKGGFIFIPSKNQLAVVYDITPSENEILLGLFSLLGNRLKKVATLPGWEDNATSPSVSADGRYLLYLSQNPTSSDQPTISILNLQTGDTELLKASNGQPLHGRSPKWVTTSQIAFVAPPPGANAQASVAEGGIRYQEECLWLLDLQSHKAWPLWPLADNQ